MCVCVCVYMYISVTEFYHIIVFHTLSAVCILYNMYTPGVQEAHRVARKLRVRFRHVIVAISVD